ncbi:MAG TPA: DUF1360 domain-containing protein [Pyrinomonadaceae bacterium]|nr:DUF1360 domain-containing protein [Pyrinomonadaceae bacterium]
MTQAQAETLKSTETDDSLFAGYKGGEEMPLAGYATLVGVYNAGFAAALLAARQSDRELPDRASLSDVLLLGIATHKLGRIITKDWVTSPLRAPFTEYKESAGGGEVNEKSRGKGLQRAVGDLLTCPWCIAPWVASALAFGFVFKPRTTRFICRVFTAVTISDFLQHAYNGVKEKK